MKSQFLRIATWTHPDGSAAGFGYTPLVYETRTEGGHGGFGPASDFRLEQVDRDYSWAVLQVDIHDFVRSFPPARPFARQLSSRIRESAYVVTHPNYSTPVSPAPPGSVAESRFGYSFLPTTVEPNFFGFGPGRFQAAIKQFRFLLLDNGDLEIRLSFIVAPRSQKVLYLWGFDPVYTLVHLINAVTLGVFKIRRRAHDRLDAVMLSLHGNVHQNLLDGMRSIWEESHWVGEEQGKTPEG